MVAHGGVGSAPIEALEAPFAGVAVDVGCPVEEAEHHGSIGDGAVGGEHHAHAVPVLGDSGYGIDAVGKRIALPEDGDERSCTTVGKAHIVQVGTFGRCCAHHGDAFHAHARIEHHGVDACEHLPEGAVVAVVCLVEIGEIDFEIDTGLSLCRYGEGVGGGFGSHARNSRNQGNKNQRRQAY